MISIIWRVAWVALFSMYAGLQRNAQIYKDVIRTEDIVLQAIKWGVKTRVECGKKIKSKFGVACGGFPVHF